MRYQLLLGLTPVVLFVFILIFRKSLNKYIAAYGKRLLVPLAAVVVGGPKVLLMVLPFYSIYFFLREYKAAQAIADMPLQRYRLPRRAMSKLSARGCLQRQRFPLSVVSAACGMNISTIVPRVG